MNNSIKLAFVAAFAAVGIAACTSTPVPENNAAPQTFSTPTSTPTSETSSPLTVVTEVVTHTVTNPPKPDAVIKVDNRIGVGATFAEVKKAYPNASEYRGGWSAPLNATRSATRSSASRATTRTRW